MSTTTTETVWSARSEDPTPAPAMTPTRGLIRATLRVHQSALWFWGLLVVLAAGGLLWAAGPGVDAAWAEYVKSGCKEVDYCEVGPAYSRFDLTVGLASAALAVAPILIGAWAGGALIARELESGTARLAWTQSASPARWLAAKLAVPAALIASGTTLLTLLHRLVWWSDEELRHALGTRDWFESETFTANGTVATAYALLGLAVGAVAGLLLRRTLPGLAVGLVGTGVLMGTLVSNRHRLWPTETLVSKTAEPAWTGEMVDRGFITSTGERVSDVACTDDACGRTDAVAFYTDFHPSSHFWPLQLVETGIVLAVTALLGLAAFRLLRRRTGGAV
ncbi:ABC transporter permease [Streptomyces europaeiscabiei]|uniref:ABC transporter permease n=1 Tax=Streptomyces europaeiscabiei TaxID=146819 RepID=UPI0029AC4C17|nr:ABC transporter permease [Streptomyces europaeiscabiei]MDX2530262.1 ABC transporter permease [Streptomyces europaeiscabiei]MDX3713690.1 ABC transporter permease [Streptomyces europaeiscabiei]